MTSRQKTWALLVVGLAVVLSVSAVIFVHSGEKSPKVHKVTLPWQAAAASPGKSVASYNEYRGTTYDGPYSNLAFGIKDPKCQDDLVSRVTSYYYSVACVVKGAT